MIKKIIKIGVLFLSLSVLLSACSFPWEEERVPEDFSQYNQDLEKNNSTDKVINEDTNENLQFSGELRKFTSLSAIKDYLSRFKAEKVSLDYLLAKTSYGVIGNTPNKDLNDSSIFQESADIVKVNGNYAYILERENIHIIQITPSEEAKEVNTLSFDNRPLEIITTGNYLAVSGVSNQALEGESTPNNSGSYTFLKIFDISSPSSPQEVNSLVFEGDYVGLRMAGDYVYFLSTTPLEVVAGKEILPIIYSSSKPLSETCSLNAKCLNSQVYYFDYNYDNYAFLSFTSLSLLKSDEPIRRQLYLVDDNYSLYFSDSNNVYLAHKDYTLKEDLEDEIKREMLFSELSDEEKAQVENLEKTSVSPYSALKNKDEVSIIINNYFNSLTKDELDSWQAEIDKALTIKVKADSKTLEINNIYKFSLNSGKLLYNAKNQVSGRLLASNSFDEENDYLRIVTTRGDLWPLLFSSDKENYSNIYILDSDLNQLGALENLTTDSEISSASFMKSRVYIAPLDSSEPIYVISLSNDNTPTILGALQVGSYSYYYPIDEDGKKLIAISKQASATESDEEAGIKLSLFDFSDLQKPSELSAFVIGDSQSDSIAFSDYKSLANMLEKKTISIPVSFKDGDALSFSGALIFNHNNAGELSLAYRIDHSAGGHFNTSDSRLGFNYYDNTVLRSFIKDDNLFTVSNKYLKINNLVDGTEVSSVKLISSFEDDLVEASINDNIGNSVEALSSEEAVIVANDFANEFLMKDGGQAEVQDVSEEYGMYKLMINIGSEIIDTYLTKDGKLFFSDVLSIVEYKGEPSPEDAPLIEISVDIASLIAKDFISEYLVDPGTNISVEEIIVDHDLYKIKVDTGAGLAKVSYMTKDGRLFFPTVISVE